MMLFSNRLTDIDDSPVVTFSREDVKLKKTGKFLGVILDNSLSFEKHISYICDKISKSIGVFYKLRSCAPENVLINLYYSLVYPYLIYCNQIWGGTYDTHIEKIFLLQKKIIRVITNQPFLAHTNHLFYNSKILKVHDIYIYLTGIYAWLQTEAYFWFHIRIPFV